MASGDVTATLSTSSERKSASFDGVDDYVEIPHNDSQLGANLSNGFTISAWIFPRTIGETNGAIINKSADAFQASGFGVYTAATNTVGFRIKTGTQVYSANNSFPFFVWNHLIITISSANLVNFYLNGVLSGVANQDTVQGINQIVTTNVLRIGNRSTATDRTFDGSIADVRIYNRVLSTTEITNLYNGEDIRDGLVGQWKLEDDYNDSSGMGNHGTNSGTYLVNTLTNRLKADAPRTLAAATDKLIVVPQKITDQRIRIIKAEREA
jgi:hypothetical protein